MILHFDVSVQPPCSRILEQFISTQLVKTIPVLYGTHT